MANQTDVVTAGSTELAPYDHAMFPELLDQDPLAVQERFAKRFAAAENMDDLFNVLTGNLSKDLVGRKVEIRQVAWAPFESDRGVIPLAICQAFDLDGGHELEFATTASSLTMFIRRAEVLKSLPFQVRIAAKKTRSGQTALNFERP